MSFPAATRQSSWWLASGGPRLRVRIYLCLAAACALVLPFVFHPVVPGGTKVPGWLTAAVLIAISMLNVEISRGLSGGLARTHQPHKALSAWAFASGLLLAAPWLLVVVPATYAHAWWRGLRLPLWKWAGSACFLVLAGLAAALARTVAPADLSSWTEQDSSALMTLLLAAAAFLTVEAVLFTGSAWLGPAEDEEWLRRTLRGPSFYGTEFGVLLIAGLMAAVWMAGPWFTAFLIPMYLLAQRAALHDPLRERAETAAQLAQKNCELEAANQLKVDLLGMMGHELGNPLTSVVGFSQVARDALNDGDVELATTGLQAVERNAGRLRNVLHDILALVSNDLGALTAHPQACRLLPHLEASTGLLPAERQPVVNCAAGLYVLAQPGHLDQILTNLLSNAEKYAGGATRVATHLSPAGLVEIAVTDAGPGVPEAFRDQLFQRFARADDTSDRVPGTGLGLYITRELARANGGSVEHRAAPGGGSTFVLTLQPSNPPAPCPTAAHLADAQR